MLTNEDLFTQKVDRVIEQKIRPALHAHGGDIALMEVKGKDIKVRFTGVCGSCPSVQNTLDDIVTGSLREELGDEIGRVILWNAVSDELINFAREFFKHKQK